jgi:hypothetical protein
MRVSVVALDCISIDLIVLAPARISVAEEVHRKLHTYAKWPANTHQEVHRELQPRVFPPTTAQE